MVNFQEFIGNGTNSIDTEKIMIESNGLINGVNASHMFYRDF